MAASPGAPIARHGVHFFVDEATLVADLVEHLHEGLSTDEAALLIVRGERWRQLAAGLAARGLDLVALHAAERLVVLDAHATLERLLDGERGSRAGLEALLAPLLRASARRRVRLYGEMVDLLAERGRIDEAVRLEEAWNDALAGRPVTLRCGYSLERFRGERGAQAFDAVCAAHDTVVPIEDPRALAAPTLQRRIARLERDALALEDELALRRRSEAHLDLLARASAALAGTLDRATVIETLLDLAVPTLGDVGFVDLLDPSSGEVVRQVRATDEGTRRLLDGTRWVRSDAAMNVCALSSGRSALHPACDEAWRAAVATSPQHLALLRELDPASLVTVPIASVGGAPERARAGLAGSTQSDSANDGSAREAGERSRRTHHTVGDRSQVTGALTLLLRAPGERRHDARDLALAEELARRAAAALENARLYAEACRALERQRELDRRKDEFLAMLGHELRNPLAPILTALELMDRRGEQAAARERAIIGRQARHLARLVDDLLDLSRIERGKVELRREDVAVEATVARAIELAQPFLARAQHALVVDVAPGLCVHGDPVRLAQALGNLVANAAKYTPDGGRVEVRAAREGDRVRLEVTDDGLGLPPDLLERVFDPFVQGPRALDRSEGGLGIGLTVARRLIELHEGTIVATSAGARQGSTFTVRLPALVAPDDAVEPTPSGVEAAAASPRRRRVLVVDDNADAADLLGDALEAFGFEVAVAHAPTGALELVGPFAPDVALVDLGLPGMDGFELAGHLRQVVGSLRLVALTGYGQDQDRERSRAAGFDAHLVKPAPLDQIVAVLGPVAA